MNVDRLVLVTDHAWPTLDREQAILSDAGAHARASATGEEDDLVALAPDAVGILCNWKPVTRRVLEAAPSCLAVGRYGVGLDNIDVAAATELGMIVTNVPDYCVDDVADHSLALLMACARKIAFFDRDMKAGLYSLAAHTPLRRLRGQTLGIAGYGRIGRAVAHRARSLGMRVLVFGRRLDPAGLRADAVEATSWEGLLARSDVISIHLPSNRDTRGLFDRAAFAAVRPGVIIVNTARGDLIDSASLLAALDNGRVSAAGLDVWTVEPLPAGDALAQHARVVATPHAAFNTVESLVELQERAARQMADVLNGWMPANIVNPAVLGQPSLRASLRRRQEDETGRAPQPGVVSGFSRAMTDQEQQS